MKFSTTLTFDAPDIKSANELVALLITDAARVDIQVYGSGVEELPDLESQALVSLKDFQIKQVWQVDPWGIR